MVSQYKNLTSFLFSDILIFRMLATSVIRNRFQLTIPESIRENLPWLTPGTAVHLSLTGDQLVVRPYREKMVDWRKIWKVLESVAGKGKQISLSKFVVNDRFLRR